MEHIEHALEILGAIVIVATVIVRLTPSESDDKTASKFSKAYFDILKVLPTLGVNPQTKKIEEAYKEIKGK